MKKQEAYQTLNVQQDASEKDIKKAYKKLVVEKHPDKLGNTQEAEDEFKKINLAFDILSNKCQAEDERNSFVDNFNNDYFNVNFHTHNNIHNSIYDFFTQKRGNQQPQQMVLEDLHFSIQVNIKQAVLGDTLDLNYDHMDFCKICKGLGKTKHDACSKCKGTGMVSSTVFSNGFIQQTNRTCDACGGAGAKYAPCATCNGTRGTAKNSNLKIKMPPITQNSVLKIGGKGNTLDNRKSALYINLVIDPIGRGEFEGYVLNNENVFLKKQIKFGDLLSGCVEQVKTIDGNTVDLVVPENSKVGNFIPINNEGVRGTNGRLVVELDLKYPNNKQLSKEEREVLDKLYEE